ncbi:MAG: hypothetical protein GY834_14005, partial [Bacteroidetes bacterium]|nr:hypothetical protein [Bacteroidota bacterium]
MVDGNEVIYSSDWVNDLENEIHFNWHYQQAAIVYDKCNKSSNILEIGVGTNLLSDLLHRRKWSIKTLDIDEDKMPDYCASADDFEYEDIDVILAFEIFEHIPYNTFKSLINKISKSEVSSVYFSV